MPSNYSESLKILAGYVFARKLFRRERILLIGAWLLPGIDSRLNQSVESSAYECDFMDARNYHICSGRSKEDAVQLEVAQGIGNAYELMIKIAAECPGSYFILCSKTKIVCGSIDTSDRQHARQMGGAPARSPASAASVRSST